MVEAIWHVALFMFGGILAAGYCAALSRNVRAYVSGEAVTRALLLHLGRLSVLIAALIGVALLGGRAFLSTMAGFAVVHTTILVGARRRA